MARALFLPSPIPPHLSALSAGALCALVRPSREEFLKINIRVRGGEREGAAKQKKIRYPFVRASPFPFPPFSLRYVYHLYFSFFFLSSLFSRRSESRAFGLSLSLFSLSLSLIIPDVANRRRRVRRGEGKGETDRFQGRELASEEVRREIVRGGMERSAGEFIFSEARRARIWCRVSVPSLVVRRINSFRRSWFARSLARLLASGVELSSLSLPLYLPPPFPPPFFFSLRSRCTCGHAGSN